jgi:hypothetical protein
MSSDNDDVERWLRLARDARAAAEQVIDPQSKRLLYGIADRYAALARRAQNPRKHSAKIKTIGQKR